MNDAWCIATSDRSLTGAEVKRRYGKRFSCEEMFRDFKDLRYGWGLSWTHIGTAQRRDRLFLLASMAFVPLILLDAAGEHTGLDKRLKTSTRPGRQLSLFRQGMRWYELLPGLKDEIRRPLLEAFRGLPDRQPLFRQVFGTLWSRRQPPLPASQAAFVGGALSGDPPPVARCVRSAPPTPVPSAACGARRPRRSTRAPNRAPTAVGAAGEPGRRPRRTPCSVVTCNRTSRCRSLYWRNGLHS
jgi:hypothetical protein